VESFDAIIVGGGPGGSSCARELRRADLDVLVLDKASFPRTKLCAGWITPEVVEDLEMEPAEYPHRFLTFDRIRVHLKGLSFDMHTPQHSIRRYEFDAWLLERSGAPTRVHRVQSIRREGDGYVVDERFRCRYLVGAGGTSCPVYRSLFREANPRARELQAATLEQEFPYDYDDPACHLWFFSGGLPGYSWYVPKAEGYLNVGIGGMSVQLKAGDEDIRIHWKRFVDELQERRLVKDHEYQSKGYSYYLRDDVETVRIDNAFLVGDAAGLATRDLCEGIGPAVRSGILAARAILGEGEYSLESIGRYSLENRLARWLLERQFVQKSRRLIDAT
jgi:flavin-dependent dehydrogenase